MPSGRSNPSLSGPLLTIKWRPRSGISIPIYPGARFVASYDAGDSQRYYLFGVNTDFAQVAAYYRTP
jgi:hypothetical protein